MLEYRSYRGIFEFDADLEVFAGYVVDIRDQIYFEGKSVDELKASMRRAVDQYLEVCEARGEEPERPFSGRLNLRLGVALHRAVAVAAAEKGESLNSWLVQAVEGAVRKERNVMPLTRRETRGGAVLRSSGRPRENTDKKTLVKRASAGKPVPDP